MKHGTTKTLRVGCTILALFLFCSFALLPQPVQAQNTVTATITVGNDPNSIAVTPNGAYAYVTNWGSGTVSVISTATNMVTANVTLPLFYSTYSNSEVLSVPAGVAVTPNGEYAYVTNNGGDMVYVISTATNTVTATVNVGSYPTNVAVTPNGEYAYVLNQIYAIGSSSVSVISTNTNTVTATVGGLSPAGVAVAPNGEYAYVTNDLTDSAYGFISGSVSVISTATNTVTATVTGLSSPGSIAVTPNGEYAYVTNVSHGTVSVINTATNTVTANVTVGSEPGSVAVTPNGEYVYVANAGSDTVSVISTANALVAPTVTSTPSTVDQGQTISLTSSSVTTGTSPDTYQWLAEAPSASSYSVISGATSSNYSFATTDSTTSGTWSFELHMTDNVGGQVTSNATSVTVNVAPTVSVRFSAVDWFIVIIVIIIVLLFIIFAWYRRRRKPKIQQTQTK